MPPPVTWGEGTSIKGLDLASEFHSLLLCDLAEVTESRALSCKGKA